MKTDDHNQPLGIVAGLADVVCQVDGSPSPTAEARSIFGEDKGVFSETNTSLIIEFADILQCATKEGDGRIVSQIFDSVTDTFFIINILAVHQGPCRQQSCQQ